MRSLLNILGLRRAPHQSAPLAISHDTTHAIDLAPVWQYAATDGAGNLLWPDDPDEVPAWRSERETWAQWAGVKAPGGYRTKREAEHALDLVAMTAERPAFVPETAGPLPVDQSARQFLTMLQDQASGQTIEFGATELDDMYAEWCTRCGVEPCSTNMLKGELRKLGQAGAGIIRKQSDSRAAGKRRRPARWIVTPPTGVAASLSVLKPRRKAPVAGVSDEMGMAA